MRSYFFKDLINPVNILSISIINGDKSLRSSSLRYPNILTTSKWVRLNPGDVVENYHFLLLVYLVFLVCLVFLVYLDNIYSFGMEVSLALRDWIGEWLIYFFVGTYR